MNHPRKCIFIFLFSFISQLSILSSESFLLNIDANYFQYNPTTPLIQQQEFQEYFLRKNVELMNEAPSKETSIDIIIISASNQTLVNFWEKRLKKTRDFLVSPETLIICVQEDWPSGGAGNGLGSLYAYKKAQEKALAKYGIDIFKEQLKGASIAMYHTAGQGKRLAPLTISELGIKSAVELPGLFHSYDNNQEEVVLMTLLEATIKQSMIFAPSRKGRLSVFWSDQVFIPSNSCQYTPNSHIDILVKKIPFPDQLEWSQKNLDNYGLLAWDENGNAKLFDKCDYQTFEKILSSHLAIADKGVGISMGAFSLSLEILEALLKEFDREMIEKQSLFDSDPYFWMPLTLDLDSYISAMLIRNVPLESIKTHYKRMQQFKKEFKHINTNSTKSFFEGIDIGKESYWWDYGTIDSYYKNNLMMTKNSLESELMRSFFRLENFKEKESYENENLNLLINSCVKKGNIKNSLVINVEAEELNISDSILIGCKIKSIDTSQSLLYHVEDNDPLFLENYMVRADVPILFDLKNLRLKSSIETDGKSNWKNRIFDNTHSWEEALEYISNQK